MGKSKETIDLIVIFKNEWLYVFLFELSQILSRGKLSIEGFYQKKSGFFHKSGS